MNDKKDKTILESLKEIENKKRGVILSKKLNEIKQKAREILELKEETNIILEELGESENAKSIIDWINSLSDVKLSKEDKESIRRNVLSDINQDKKELEHEIKEKPTKFFYPVVNNYHSIQDRIIDVNDSITIGKYAITCSNSGGIGVDFK